MVYNFRPKIKNMRKNIDLQKKTQKHPLNFAVLMPISCSFLKIQSDALFLIL